MTLSDVDSDGILHRYRHYPGHIPSLFFFCLITRNLMFVRQVYVNHDFCVIRLLPAVYSLVFAIRRHFLSFCRCLTPFMY
ncbi:hypothetical protein DWW25_03720 [Bacteroides xylanisolvens]|uniref:Uncharacterized protein n=1 Tax=Bacteroides xylanisolvens TaxID=371601 RepID=A0A412W2S5_9BACE|nr:hypothetical protein DWW25_03720 [Bacteroides xylanisolvens]